MRGGATSEGGLTQTDQVVLGVVQQFSDPACPVPVLSARFCTFCP